MIVAQHSEADTTNKFTLYERVHDGDLMRSFEVFSHQLLPP